MFRNNFGKKRSVSALRNLRWFFMTVYRKGPGLKGNYFSCCSCIVIGKDGISIFSALRKRPAFSNRSIVIYDPKCLCNLYGHKLPAVANL